MASITNVQGTIMKAPEAGLKIYTYTPHISTIYGWCMCLLYCFRVACLHFIDFFASLNLCARGLGLSCCFLCCAGLSSHTHTFILRFCFVHYCLDCIIGFHLLKVLTHFAVRYKLKYSIYAGYISFHADFIYDSDKNPIVQKKSRELKMFETRAFVFCVCKWWELFHPVFAPTKRDVDTRDAWMNAWLTCTCGGCLWVAFYICVSCRLVHTYFAMLFECGIFKSNMGHARRVIFKVNEVMHIKYTVHTNLKETKAWKYNCGGRSKVSSILKDIFEEVLIIINIFEYSSN